MKQVWIVTDSADGSESILSIHESREGATLAAQKAWAMHDENCMSLAQREKYRTWESDLDSFSCTFISNDISYTYSAFREEVLP